MNELNFYEEKNFDSIKNINEFGEEYWFARDLMQVLDYKKWQKFTNVIETAKVACDKSNNTVSDHFIQVGKMVEIGSNTKRKIIDYKLSRYAC